MSLLFQITNVPTSPELFDRCDLFRWHVGSQLHQAPKVTAWWGRCAALLHSYQFCMCTSPVPYVLAQWRRGRRVPWWRVHRTGGCCRAQGRRDPTRIGEAATYPSHWLDGVHRDQPDAATRRLPGHLHAVDRNDSWRPDHGWLAQVMTRFISRGYHDAWLGCISIMVLHHRHIAPGDRAKIFQGDPLSFYSDVDVTIELIKTIFLVERRLK
jgi:hypothetical protein